MMQFNDLLRLANLDPARVAVMLHNPTSLDQRRLLFALVEEEPELFMAYQDNHPRNQEATLKSRPYAASFVGDAQEARFVALYQVNGSRFCTGEAMDAEPRRAELIRRLGERSYKEWAAEKGVAGREIFDLQPHDGLKDLRGRLVVGRPPGRNHMRLAENCPLPVLAIDRAAQFSPPAPDWHEMVVTGPQLRGLARDWRARLREWRGIYHIIDTADGARYVGSAYGDTNLLGRWLAHVAGEAGVTAELSRRDPAGFRFSILELLAPNADADDVIQAESRWKDRLATRTWGLNRN